MDRRDDILGTARSSETTDHDSIVMQQLACRGDEARVRPLVAERSAGEQAALE
jgi:hypothetical protein